MKIAAAQIACVLGDREANLKKIRQFAAQAKEAGAELVVYPETADTGYSISVIQDIAMTRSQGSVPALSDIAKEFSLAIICGISERVDKGIYNSQVFIDAEGKVAGHYRKCHLFGAGESACFSPGDELSSLSYEGFQLGLSICYDLRFPEVYRKLATEDKSDVFVVSSAWPLPRTEHLRILSLARAIENQSYLVLANRVGRDKGLTFCGSSAIISPSGEILASASADGEELVTAELSQEVLGSVRERMTVFADRREDLYAGKARPASGRAGG